MQMNVVTCTLSDKSPMLETLDFAFHIGSTPTLDLDVYIHIHVYVDVDVDIYMYTVHKYTYTNTVGLHMYTVYKLGRFSTGFVVFPCH